MGPLAIDPRNHLTTHQFYLMNIYMVMWISIKNTEFMITKQNICIVEIYFGEIYPQSFYEGVFTYFYDYKSTFR